MLYHKLPNVINIKVIGLGGQGVITTGKVLAVAALKAKYFPVVGEMRNAARRGGNVECDVRITQQPFTIDAKIPLGYADIVINFNPQQIDWIISNQVHKNSLVFQSQDSVKVADHLENVAGFYNVKDKQASLRAGNPKASNMAMLGAMFKAGVLPFALEHFQSAMQEVFIDKLRKINTAAFEMMVQDEIFSEYVHCLKHPNQSMSESIQGAD